MRLPFSPILSWTLLLATCSGSFCLGSELYPTHTFDLDMVSGALGPSADFGGFVAAAPGPPTRFLAASPFSTGPQDIYMGTLGSSPALVLLDSGLQQPTSVTSLNDRIGYFDKLSILTNRFVVYSNAGGVWTLELDEQSQAGLHTGLNHVVSLREYNGDLGFVGVVPGEQLPFSVAGATRLDLSPAEVWVADWEDDIPLFPNSAAEGYSIAASGQYVMIGEPFYDDFSLDVIYNTVQLAKLVEVADYGPHVQWFSPLSPADTVTTPNINPDGDRFGAQVAFGGTGWAAISSPGEEYAVFQVTEDVGAVRLYQVAETADGFSLSLTQKLQPPSPQGGEHFGEAIAFDETGTLLVVGSPGWTNPACVLPLICPDSGRSFLYRRTLDQWDLVATLLPAANEWGQLFGSAVAVAGNDVLVSAPMSNAGMATNTAGRVYSFEGVGQLLFKDGFEAGTTSEWSSAVLRTP